ncbi:AMP-binding protein [Candidatus Poriferisodalis multihospitum]|uniref:AMP-binding protein n=1 Tax=Candidatus Poriferisodalis multihospitum TaxID=2983191 RepID=UPI002B259BF6|nr:AMP-binding protein [Candidatus Poriferisodalis multihospitum]
MPKFEPTAGRGLHPIENAPIPEIRALQLERLKWSLAHAYAHVPAYQQLFDEAGVHPSDLHTLNDLARFPFTSKTELRENYPFGMFAVPREQVLRVHASSGTTGKPTVVGYTQSDLDMWAHVFGRSLMAAGVRPGDVVHVSYGYGLFTGGLGAHYGAEQYGCTVVPASVGQTARQVQLLVDFDADVLCATPSYALVVADEFRNQGIDPASTSLRVGIFGAEPWSEAMRAELEEAFGIDAVDIYGLSEVIGGGVANECVETKDGPTIWEDHFYPEIIDPDSGEVLPEGETGELVFTSLTKVAMPVIRYRTRDICSLQPGTARSMRRMGRVAARSDDMLIIRGVNVFPSQFEELVSAEPRLTGHFFLEVHSQGRMEGITAVLEPKLDAGEHEAIAADFAGTVRQRIGISVDVRTVEPEGIPRSEGKAQRVRDLRG